MATSKVIKEIVTDVGGNTTIEYSDDTTQKYNVADVVTAQSNPLTGRIIYSSNGGADDLTENLKASDASKWPVKDPRSSTLKVQVTPATITDSTTNALSAGQLFRPVNLTNTGIGSSAFSFFRGAYWTQKGAGSPDYMYLTANTFTQGSPSPYANLQYQVSFIHTGSRFAIQSKGTGQKFVVKIDGEFVSLTQTSIAVDGNAHYTLVDMGTVARRRIDIQGTSLLFGGVWIDMAATIEAAQKRGPKVVVMSDSFGEGTGNENGQLMSYIWYMAESLGWDDVIPSAVGSTGLLAGTAPKVKFADRAVRDVCGVSPDVALVVQSINDSARTVAEITTEASNLLGVMRAGGFVGKVLFASPTTNVGPGWQTSAIKHNKAMRAWCAANGCGYLDVNEFALTSPVKHTTTTTSAISVNAKSVPCADNLVPGATYEFDDGSAFVVRSISGLTATVDNISTAQSSGATVTQRGATLLSGNGHIGATTGYGVCDLAVCAADTTHASDLGHSMLGNALAIRFHEWLTGR